jgi:hypothetical protein
MGGPDGYPGPTVGYLHFIDRDASVHAYADHPSSVTYLLLASLLFFPGLVFIALSIIV